MKTAGGRKTKPLRHHAQQTEHMGGRLGQILLNYAGWKLRKNPATGEVFFLTSPFIEVVSMGRRNTFLQFTRRGLKT
jgi:hypothetical protein